MLFLPLALKNEVNEKMKVNSIIKLSKIFSKIKKFNFLYT